MAKLKGMKDDIEMVFPIPFVNLVAIPLIIAYHGGKKLYEEDIQLFKHTKEIENGT